jgi:adenylate kinase family enzyme
MYRWRLQQNDAQNIGYVLDGFPKTADQANALFTSIIYQSCLEKVTLEDETT